MDARVLDPHVYTALPIAAARAVAFGRPDSLIQDPLARKLLDSEAQNLIRNGAAANVEYMTMRALIGDELVQEGHRAGTRQVVSLGAGLDSRAFRLGLTDTIFYEFDHQDLFTWKEPLVADVPLQCAARHTVVGTIGKTDIHKALRAYGFSKDQPTTWLMEGLAPYLTRPEMINLAADIGRLSAPGSRLWLDGFSKTSVARGMSFHGVDFESGFDDYDELWRKNGFDFAEAIDMAGVDIDRRAKRIQVDSRYVLTEARTKGRQMCLMARASKSASAAA